MADATPVVVAPTLTYHFYPAFLEYPGSTSLSLATARDMTADVVRTLSGYGPRRFYVLNTGVSTTRALEPAAALLASAGVLMRYTNLSARLDQAGKGLIEQAGGSHADEVETSMMLYIDPASVDMTKAVKDYTPSPGGGATHASARRQRHVLANRYLGRSRRAPRERRVESSSKRSSRASSKTSRACERRRCLRRPATAPPAAEPSRPATAAPATALNLPERCSPGDERTILALGSAFANHWDNGDYERLGAMWSRSGDIFHPDGAVERGSQLITINRMQLFARREYRNTRHPLVLNMVRCLSEDIAVADGKWELRGVLDSAGKPLPMMEGQVTLVTQTYQRLADRGVSIHPQAAGTATDHPAGSEAPWRRPDVIRNRQPPRLKQRLEVRTVLDRRENRVLLERTRAILLRDALQPRDGGIGVSLLHARSCGRHAEIPRSEALPLQLLELRARRGEL